MLTPGSGPEFASFPPDKPLLLIPLKGAVECYDNLEEVPETPEEYVEAFFTLNQPIFQAVEDAYTSVGICDQAATEHNQALEAQLQELELQRRRAGRKRPVESTYTGPHHAPLEITKARAAHEYPKILRRVESGRPLEHDHEAYIEVLRQEYAAAVGTIFQREGHASSHSDSEKLVTQTVLIQISLTAANLYALFRQDVALRKIEEFTQDETIIPAFLDRLQSLATSERPSPYPGLLELVATHAQQRDVLQGMVQEISPKTVDYAQEYLSEMLSSTTQPPKELLAIKKVMHLTADLLDDEHDIKLDDFTHLFAGRVAAWPRELRLGLTEYAEKKNDERWQAFASNLQPFVRPERFPSKVDLVHVSEAYGKKRRTSILE